MYEEKKKYLNQYLLQESAISSLEQLAIQNPQKRSEYEKRICNCMKLREEIEEKIYAVDNRLLSELLCQKYMLGKTLEQMGYILNYSKRHIERLHIKALEEFKL